MVHPDVNAVTTLKRARERVGFFHGSGACTLVIAIPGPVKVGFPWLLLHRMVTLVMKTLLACGQVSLGRFISF
jgi:hypothetical protein